ncbi:MAG: ATP-binding protein [Pseudomonadota bacterium]
MNRLFSLLLKNYDNTDRELLLKAKLLFVTTFIVVLGLTITLAYTSYTFGIESATVLTESIGFIIMLAALILLLRGSYIIAVHIIFITGFSVAWILMFNEPVSSLLIKLDTIVFILGLMSAMPLMFLKDRKPMILYFIFNYGIFVCFNYYLFKTAGLTAREHIDYALDNTIALLFVFVVSYNLFAIYNQALNSLKNELVEREKAQESLKKFRAFLSSIINSMPSVIIGVDKNYEIVIWNDEAIKITGVSQDRAFQKNLFDMFPQLDSYDREIQTVMVTNTISKMHKRPLVYLGKERFTDIAIYPLYHGEINGAVIRIDDISERLQMEEVIAQSEKMLSVGGLAAGMAHELNNPLGGMIQSAQVIHNRLTQNIPANDSAARELGSSMAVIRSFMEKRGILNQLNNINEAGRRAAQIVSNMLSFVRKTESCKERNNMAELINKAIELARSDYDLNNKYDFRKIKLVREYDPKTPEIHCEKSKIQQVLFNILKNASEAISMQTEKNPAPMIIVRLFQDPGMACIEIEDNGPGMDEATRKRIFEPFFTTKPVDRGTGLGLSVSYFIIVEDHGGRLKVESTPGIGTKFIICLPKTP